MSSDFPEPIDPVTRIFFPFFTEAVIISYTRIVSTVGTTIFQKSV